MKPIIQPPWGPISSCVNRNNNSCVLFTRQQGMEDGQDILCKSALISSNIGRSVHFKCCHYRIWAHMKPEWPLTNKEPVITRQKQTAGCSPRRAETQDEQAEWREKTPSRSLGELRQGRLVPVWREKVDGKTTWPNSWKSVTKSGIKVTWTGCLFQKLLKHPIPQGRI